jgi:hypothetical protein
VATVHTETLVAVFEKRGQAEGAIDALWHSGFRQDQIGIASPGSPAHETTTPTQQLEKTGDRGAIAGSIAGGAIGAVLGGLAVALIPGVGQVIVGGTLIGTVAGVVTGAAAGAAGGAYMGPFLTLGFSREEASRYERHLREGRTIVTIHPDGQEDRALTIIKSHGGRIATSDETQTVQP